MWFDSWRDVGRVALLALIGYATLVVLVRVSGRRTLSSLNVVDLVVTVAAGNVIAMMALSERVSVANGTAALAALVLLEFATDWTALRWGWFRRATQFSPVLVYYRGRFMRDAMRRERLSEEDVRAAVRREGIPSLDEVEAAVLENAGTITIVRRSERRLDVLVDVEGGAALAGRGPAE